MLCLLLKLIMNKNLVLKYISLQYSLGLRKSLSYILFCSMACANKWKVFHIMENISRLLHIGIIWVFKCNCDNSNFMNSKSSARYLKSLFVTFIFNAWPVCGIFFYFAYCSFYFFKNLWPWQLCVNHSSTVCGVCSVLLLMYHACFAESPLSASSCQL